MASRGGKVRTDVSVRFLGTSLRTFGIVLCSSWILAASGCGRGSNSPSLPASPTLQAISVSPQNSTIAAGLTEQYSATAHYSDGSSKPTSTVTWATSNTSVATISSTGLATSVAAGTTTIRATSSNISGSTTLTVTGAPQVLN